MTQSWEPGTSYELNSIVEYEGRTYRAIQPHFSLTTRRPSQRLPSAPSSGGAFRTIVTRSSSQVPSAMSTRTSRLAGSFQQMLSSAFGRGFSGSRWDDRNEERRQAWSEEDWLRESEQRTKDYLAHGPRGPATWILVEGRNIPDCAIFTGEERGERLYVCRAWHEGSLQVGKASWSFKLGGIIGYANKEHHVSKYEVLIAEIYALRWNECYGRLNLAALPGRPVEGGREADATPLFVAKAPYHGAEVPGKCSERHSGALIPYGGEEKEIRQFQVLCYA